VTYRLYRFGTWEDLSRTGDYWRVEPVGQPTPARPCSCPGGP
jgi:hypothetical protein